VAYSEGFSPRPKLSFGLALSVSHESDAEYLDVELSQLHDIEGLPQALTAALPDGLDVVDVIALAPGTASLQQAIVSCTWRIEVLGASLAEVEAAVAATVASSELPLERVRKGKTAVADVRPAILELRVAGPTNDGVELAAELATETVSIRPTELVEVLNVDGLVEGRVQRTHQWMMIDEVRCEPVSRPDPSSGHELRRAS
jgi:radical SAM-linked protein